MNLKRLILPIVLALMLPAMAAAHSVSLSFTKSADDTGATGQGYTAYRLSGTCPANVTTTTGFTALNATLFTGNTYTDATVTPGTYCYLLTFTSAGASSNPSNTAGTSVLPAAPTNVTVTSSN